VKVEPQAGMSELNVTTSSSEVGSIALPSTIIFFPPSIIFLASSTASSETFANGFRYSLALLR